MSYATVQDVEDRIGYVLDEAAAKALEIFLDELSAALDSELSRAGVDPSTIGNPLKLSLVAAKGKLFTQQWDLNPYLASWSQGDDGATEAKTFRASAESALFTFSRSDLKRLGLSTFKFSTFSTEYRWGGN